MTGSSNASMRCDEKNQRELKSGFEGVCGIQICKTGNPPTFCSNWPNESCQDQTNKQAH